MKKQQYTEKFDAQPTVVLQTKKESRPSPFPQLTRESQQRFYNHTICINYIEEEKNTHTSYLPIRFLVMQKGRGKGKNESTVVFN